MKSRLSTKLTVSYGVLFAFMYTLASIVAYNQAEKIVSASIDASLDSTSDLIKRIVQVSIENNRGQVSKDLIVAEHLIGTDVRIDESRSDRVTYRNSITEETGGMRIPALLIGGAPILGSGDLVNRIHRETQDIVTVFQSTSEGFLSVASSRNLENGEGGPRTLIPNGSPIDILVRRMDTYYGRDYFDKRWYLTAWKLLHWNGRIVGALFVAIEQTDLLQLRRDILSIRIGREGFPYIIDTLSTVVIHPRLEGQNLYSLSHINELIFLKDGHIRYAEPDQRGGPPKERIAYFKFVPEMNWIVVVGSSMEDLFGGLYALRAAFLVISILALLVVLLSSYLIGRRATKPIRFIAQKFKEIAEGEADLSRRLYVKSNDEVEELSTHFNQFLDKLKALKAIEKREIEVTLKDAQMQALQAQINPHFLYNTLETINFMIAMKDPRSTDMVRILADLFRTSIGRGERYVTVRQEIQHVRLFLAIQEMRYPALFEAHFNIDPVVMPLFTIKFLLQPIVENAILHGFNGKDRGGKLEISGRMDGDRVLLKVADNGRGIGPERLAMISGQLRGTVPGKSIGLLNVHERINLHFGDAYGIDLESSPDSGTSVGIALPVLRAEPETSFAVHEASKFKF